MFRTCHQCVRILVAEDNAFNKTVVLSFLKKLGYKADLVVNGAEAVKAMQTTPYDLMLMDCLMPTMDGYTATNLIGSAATGATNPMVPIIALTATASNEDRQRCIAAGMNDCLQTDEQQGAGRSRGSVACGEGRQRKRRSGPQPCEVSRDGAPFVQMDKQRSVPTCPRITSG
jgi:CheY-like chemotaxis protein